MVAHSATHRNMPADVDGGIQIHQNDTSVSELHEYYVIYLDIRMHTLPSASMPWLPLCCICPAKGAYVTIWLHLCHI